MSTDCPCGSGRPYEECCKPFHLGRPAPSAEELMRSRYCAYAMGVPEYIITTTHPANPLYRSDLKAWTEEIRRFGEETSFNQLEIRNSSQENGTATVTFVAHLFKGDEDLTFTETSEFEKVGNRWLYRSGKVTR